MIISFKPLLEERGINEKAVVSNHTPACACSCERYPANVFVPVLFIHIEFNFKMLLFVAKGEKEIPKKTL